MRFHLFLPLLPLVLARPHSQLRLFHRLYDPLAGEAPFTLRGTVTIGEDLVFTQSSSFQDDFKTFAGALEHDPHLSLYQVALEHPGDHVESQWDISSVKACHLSLSKSETIVLHALNAHDPAPHALDYFIAPVPHDGSCPKSMPRAEATNTSPFVSFARSVNTTVISRGASLPPLPTLKAPPALSPDGEPVAPLPEKTFLQKYWMYILAFVIVILFSGGPEEEQPRKVE